MKLSHLRAFPCLERDRRRLPRHSPRTKWRAARSPWLRRPGSTGPRPTKQMSRYNVLFLQRTFLTLITLPKASDRHLAMFSRSRFSMAKSRTLTWSHQYQEMMIAWCLVTWVMAPLHDCRGLYPPLISSWSWPITNTPPSCRNYCFSPDASKSSVQARLGLVFFWH